MLRCILTALVSLLPLSSQACIVFAGFESADVIYADLVFEGEVIEYEYVAGGEQPSLRDYALITFRVDRALRGSTEDEVTLYWWNSTFGVRGEWNHSTALIVAAQDPTSPVPPLRSGSGVTKGIERPDLHQILQAPCSAPFFLPRDVRVADAITKILVAEPQETPRIAKKILDTDPYLLRPEDRERHEAEEAYYICLRARRRDCSRPSW